MSMVHPPGWPRATSRATLVSNPSSQELIVEATTSNKESRTTMKQHTIAKRLIGAATALAASFGLAAVGVAPALATPAAPAGGTIVVTGAEEVEDPGLKISIYKVANDQSNEPQHSWDDSIKGWVAGQFPTYTDNGVVTSTFKSLNGAEVKTFYDKLAAGIKSGDVSGATPAATKNTTNGEATFAGVEVGTYLILIEDGLKVYEPSAVNVTDAEGATVEIKSSDLSVGIATTADSVQPGGTLPFTIEASVPTYPANALNKTYKISDPPNTYLTSDIDSIKVVGVAENGTETGLTDDAYTVATTPATAVNGLAFTLDFDYTKISGYKTIKVTYSATVSPDLTPGQPVKDGAGLTFANSPYVQGDEGTATINSVDVERYTYGVEAKKIASDTNGALSDAKFVISTSDSVDDAIKVTHDAGNTYVAKVGSTDTQIASGSDGTFTITGLTLGTYYLIETQAPEHYIKVNPIDFELTDDQIIGTLDENDTDETGIYEYGNITDPREFSLANTGAAGIAFMILAGAALFGGGFFLAVKNRRQQNN